MMAVAKLYRHPIKSHGREAIDHVTLTKGQTMPWDRHWAVTHEATRFDPDAPQWESCRNFMIGSRTPGLAGIWASFDAQAGKLTLSHRDLDPICFDPDDADDAARFLSWVAPLCPENRAAPQAVVKAPGRGMTDSPFPSISIMSLSSHAAVADALEAPLALERWRGNIFVEGAPPWSEHDWLGREIRIGTARLMVRERIRRCTVTNTDPVSGTRDMPTLDTLQTHFGHQDFGVYAGVTVTGDIALGDTVEVF